MTRRAAVLVMIVSTGCTGSDGSGRAEATRCEALRDHIVDLRLLDAPGVDRAAHRDAMRDALGQAFVDSCARTLTEAQVDCTLKASDVAGATACAGESP